MSLLPDDFKLEKNVDIGSGFEPMKGKAVAVVEDVKRNSEPWPSGDPKDQLSLMLRIETCVEGDCTVNRVVFKQYSLIDTEYKGKVTTVGEHVGRLVKDLYTADYEVDAESVDTVVATTGLAIGTKLNISCYIVGGKQRTMIVDEFSKKKPTTTEAITEESPV